MQFGVSGLLQQSCWQSGEPRHSLLVLITCAGISIEDTIVISIYNLLSWQGPATASPIRGPWLGCCMFYMELNKILYFFLGRSNDSLYCCSISASRVLIKNFDNEDKYRWHFQLYSRHVPLSDILHSPPCITPQLITREKGVLSYCMEMVTLS